MNLNTFTPLTKQTVLATLTPRETWGKIVFTNGCFDILHPGHVQLLNDAKKLGDTLVVGINSDASVKELKGPTRPVHNEQHRAFILANLKAVDVVVVFEEQTPISLIETIRPDVHVKGGDYNAADLPETAIIESYGGIVQIVPFVQGHSTTSIIDSIIQST